MELSKKQQFENYFYVFLGGFLGFLITVFFLHFIYYLIQGDHVFFKGIKEINLISFFRMNFEREILSIGIIIVMILFGMFFSKFIITKYNLKKVKAKNNILEDLDKTRTEFIHLASHQLRTPLTALKWSINMILEGNFGSLNKKQRDILIKAYAANEGLIVLIGELLNVAQIESKRVEINLKSLSLIQFQKIVKQTVHELKVLANKKNLFLTFKSFLPSLPQSWVKVDISKIRQTIQSLLENAIRYTPSGKNIKAEIKFEKNEIVIRIIDEGIGIAKKEQAKIFNKFFRTNSARRMLSGGTGLGLYLSKIFIEAHDGKIWFVSKENKGSVFSFSLPLKIGTPSEEFLRKL